MPWKSKPATSVQPLAHVVDENDRIVLYVPGSIPAAQRDSIAKDAAGYHLDARELATVLYALRKAQASPPTVDSSDHFADVEPLTADEIGALCERMNCGA